jgi:Major Facilitator Superfamily
MAPSAVPRAPRRAGIGLYFGVVQFFFAATWVVYVIYLPQLAAQAGIGKGAVATILMADQLIFVFADFATGVAADKVARVIGRLGLVALAATLLSCAAFFALPLVAPAGAPAAFIAVTALWAVTSSALRAPPLALIGKHAAKPDQPVLIALSVLGLGVASALAPFLALTLRGVDPRLPFALASAALAAVTLGLITAERRLARTAPDLPGTTDRAEVSRPARAPTALVLVTVALAALAFQVHVFIDSSPLYLRHAAAIELPLLAPVFWVGFNLALLPFSLAARRWPAARVLVAATVLAAAAAAATRVAPGLSSLVAAQCITGAGWAGAVVAAFAWATSRKARAGALAGALSSLLALATLIRMGSVAAGWPQAADLQQTVAWWPAVGWIAASALLFAGWRWRGPRDATGDGSPT